MLYGKGHFYFSNCPGPVAHTESFAVYRRQHDNQLCLAAGYAHGVCEEEEYVLFPLHDLQRDDRRSIGTSIRAKVSVARGLTSELVAINPNVSVSGVKTGWQAKPTSRLASCKVYIRLTESIENPQMWLDAMMHVNHFSVIRGDTEGPACLFAVEHDKHHGYRILDASHMSIATLPSIPSNQPNSVGTVVDMLEHIAIFKFIEGIENKTPSAPFEASFEMALLNSKWEDRTNDGVLTLTHGDCLSLTVRNLGPKPLYLAVLDLCPSWKVINLVSLDGGGDYIVISPGEEECIDWSMIVPEWLQKKGLSQCEDVIKIFVTERPTSFAPLSLPEIPMTADAPGRHVRGQHNLLNGLLSQLSHAIRHAAEENDNWTTRNFIVHTFCPSNQEYLYEPATLPE
ncbi:hypothetical protein VTN00DRAFT_3800 [Thermoascus crustaceus]|uniref:uncharacterized protein n=1 Tax=Thermoascus crustaceus TaxID=5088 RepID=UPI0037438777